MLTRHDVVFYVTGHGLGHGARVGAVAGALRRLAGPRLRVAARSAAPAGLIQRCDPQTEVVARPPEALDPGAVQPHALEVDRAATVQGHERFALGFAARAGAEAQWLRAAGARVVVADVAPLGCAAARRAGIPSLAVGNFGWDALLRPWAKGRPALAAALEQYAAAYAEALALRLPLHAGIEAFARRLDAGHAVRPLRRSRSEIRRALGLAGSARPLLLVSLGAEDLRTLGVREVDAGDALVAAWAPAPPGTRGPWKVLEGEAQATHPEILAAADAVLAKPGYGTVAEALVYRTRFLALPRPGWPETAPLEAGLVREGCCERLSREDFVSGRWRPALDALLARPRPRRAAPAGGAARAAELALAHL